MQGLFPLSPLSRSLVSGLAKDLTLNLLYTHGLMVKLQISVE